MDFLQYHLREKACNPVGSAKVQLPFLILERRSVVELVALQAVIGIVACERARLLVHSVETIGRGNPERSVSGFLDCGDDIA